jgi:hypothetical protein
MIKNRFAALENIYDTEDINRAWRNTKHNIKTSAEASLGLYELKQHKPWFEKECSQFLHQTKQVKSQWLLDPKQNNIDNLNNVRREASRHFRNKKKEYLKIKIDVLENKGKITKYKRLIIHGVNYVRQTGTHTAEQPATEPSASEVDGY